MNNSIIRNKKKAGEDETRKYKCQRILRKIFRFKQFYWLVTCYMCIPGNIFG